ncbi:p51 late protein [Helicoverpa zea nudivirus 2]|uniref:p51 late protein n=1 Tax=Helicoverpa zea nudivirus 2 TaxID=1128424 RepID=G9I099_HZNV2|nr:orf73 gene product [Helicoverpa zea nudivirus 2]AEW69622.1 p51 late protein [Helicoverpa zea nudivirus 2]
MFANIQLNQQQNCVVIDNVPYEVNGDLEFFYNGEPYVVYLNTLPLRKHNNFQVSDVYTETFSIMRKSMALELAQCFANLVPIVNIGLPVTKTCKAALEDIMNHLNAMVNSNNDPNNAIDQNSYAQIQSLMKTVAGLMNKLTNSQLVTYLTYGNVQSLRMTDEYSNISQKLTAIRQYIVCAITFKPEFVNHRSLSLMFDVFLNIVGTLCLLHSHTFVEYRNVQDLIIHEIGIAIESLIYDRCSKVLFIDGANQVASGMYNDLKIKYPELKSINSENDLAKIKHLEAAFNEENAKYNVNLFPYMLFYNMSDAVRIRQNLRCIHEMRKNVANDVEQFEKFHQFVVECYNNLIEPLNGKHYATYTFDSMQKIFTHAIFEQVNPGSLM